MMNVVIVILFVVLVQISLPPIDAAPSDRVERAAKEVCYGDLGCFSTEKPWSSFGRIAFLPQPPTEINTKFLLFTRKTSNEPYRLIAGDEDGLGFSPFEPTKPIKFIVHGWIDDGSIPWLKKMAMKFLIQGDFNVFIVDWGGGSKTIYGQAAANTRVVAAEIAKMVRFLSTQTDLKHDDVHVIGHSLGAEIAGYVGYALKDLGRITGMDPASPYFENMDPLIRLDETDAKFVDVVHTDADSVLNTLILEGGCGTWQPSGHVDVYVNGGKTQPGCDQNPIGTIISEGISAGGRQVVACDHNRAPEVTIETIVSSCPYRAYLCRDWNDFQTGQCLRCPSDGHNKTWCNGVGLKAFKPADGSFNRMYWMATSGKSPFCLYHYHVRLTLAERSNREQKGKVWFRLVGNRASGDFFAVNNGEPFSLKDGSVNNFLVTSPTDLGESINSVEVQWEHDASLFDVTQWFQKKPKIYLESIAVFSGEHQNEALFCDRSFDPLESKYSRYISRRC